MTKQIVGTGKHVFEVLTPFGNMADGQGVGRDHESVCMPPTESICIKIAVTTYG